MRNQTEQTENMSNSAAHKVFEITKKHMKSNKKKVQHMFGLMKTMHRSKDKCKMGFENRQISIVVFDL